MMHSFRFGRVATQSLRGAHQRMGAATLANFQTPKVANEPNVRCQCFLYAIDGELADRRLLL